MLSLILLSVLLGSLQSQVETLPLDYVCPMDPDVRAALPGSCSRCGVKLGAGVVGPIGVVHGLKLRPRRDETGLCSDRSRRRCARSKIAAARSACGSVG